MIEDKELRDLFKTGSAEHFENINTALFHLEKDPANIKQLESIFREVHSFKGSARMIGEVDIELLLHNIEEIICKAKQKEIKFDLACIDHIYKGLDALRRLTNEAVTDEPAGVDISNVISEIKNFKVKPVKKESKGAKKDKKKDKKIKKVVEAVSDEIDRAIETVADNKNEHETDIAQSVAKDFHIDFVRVKTDFLDELMTQAGELAVINTHLARYLHTVDDITELWEESSIEQLSMITPPLQSEAETAPGLSRNIYDKAPYQENIEQFSKLFKKLKKGIYEYSSRLNFISGRIEENVQKIRLVPLSTIFNFFPMMVRDIAGKQSKIVDFVIEGGDTVADKRIIETINDPVMHLLRNAIDHGIELPEKRKNRKKNEAGLVRLKAYRASSKVIIEVEDDGNGLDIERIRNTAIKKKLFRKEELALMTNTQIQSLIFKAGFSTSPIVSDISGRGIGLDVMLTNVESLKGTIKIISTPKKGSLFQIILPATLATVRVFIANVRGIKYAIPVEYIETTLMMPLDEVFSIEGRSTITYEGKPVSVAGLVDILELKDSIGEKIKSTSKTGVEKVICIILSVNDERFGLFVDSLEDEQEVLLKPQGGVLKRVRNVAGTTILDTGEICMVLNPHDLLKSLRKSHDFVAPKELIVDIKRKKVILLVEDNIITRTQEKRILEGSGYEVVVAVDGVDAFNKLPTRDFDAVVTDINMPNMDGLSLTEKIRNNKKHKELPVVLVTALATEEDKRRGIDIGANAYITKPSFDHKVFLEILKRFV